MCKHSYLIKFDESFTDGQTDQWTNRWTDQPKVSVSANYGIQSDKFYLTPYKTLLRCPDVILLISSDE